ncbi:hypothetical protein SAMN05421868_10122 [Paenibacillus naphthalenovorans]|nr:hypothetical protein SAMN05421868_10122 [Paenibacillus naphthalenovorans]
MIFSFLHFFRMNMRFFCLFSSIAPASGNDFRQNSPFAQNSSRQPKGMAGNGAGKGIGASWIHIGLDPYMPGLNLYRPVLVNSTITRTLRKESSRNKN